MVIKKIPAFLLCKMCRLDKLYYVAGHEGISPVHYLQNIKPQLFNPQKGKQNRSRIIILAKTKHQKAAHPSNVSITAAMDKLYTREKYPMACSCREYCRWFVFTANGWRCRIFTQCIPIGGVFFFLWPLFASFSLPFASLRLSLASLWPLYALWYTRVAEGVCAFRPAVLHPASSVHLC